MKKMTVAVGVVFNSKKEVLIALRPAHVSSPGLWEFPGGKVEQGETLEQALVREYQEEIDITPTAFNHFLTINDTNAERELTLECFRILTFDGEPFGKENQIVKWAQIDSLSNYTFPSANIKLLVALRAL